MRDCFSFFYKEEQISMLSQEFILDEQHFKLLEHRNTKLLTLLLEAGADVKLLQVLVVVKQLCNRQLRIRTTDLKYLRFSLVTYQSFHWTQKTCSSSRGSGECWCWDDNYAAQERCLSESWSFCQHISDAASGSCPQRSCGAYTIITRLQSGC